MIRPLRQWHRRTVIVLGIFLPVAFAVGIAARNPVRGMTSLPPEMVESSHKFTVTEWERADLFTKAPLQVELLREAAGAGNFALRFSTARDFVEPDLIVYWVTGNPNSRDALPDNARLIGVFNPATPLPLPAQPGPTRGALVLYSLADQGILETSKTFSIP